MKKLILFMSLIAMSSTVFGAQISRESCLRHNGAQVSRESCLRHKAYHEKAIRDISEMFQNGEISEEEFASEVQDLNTEAKLYNDICPISVRFTVLR